MGGGGSKPVSPNAKKCHVFKAFDPVLDPDPDKNPSQFGPFTKLFGFSSFGKLETFSVMQGSKQYVCLNK